MTLEELSNKTNTEAYIQSRINILYITNNIFKLPTVNQLNSVVKVWGDRSYKEVTWGLEESADTGITFHQDRKIVAIIKYMFDPLGNSNWDLTLATDEMMNRRSAPMKQEKVKAHSGLDQNNSHFTHCYSRFMDGTDIPKDILLFKARTGRLQINEYLYRLNKPGGTIYASTNQCPICNPKTETIRHVMECNPNKILDQRNSSSSNQKSPEDLELQMHPKPTKQKP